jgi:hypothetical protein
MPEVNITLTTGRTFDWQSGKLDWSDEKRAAIFRRFWAKVNRADAKACWLWKGQRGTHGYGMFGLGRQVVRAHRFAWMASRGPIPAGQEVCHRCDVKLCVNPAHLFVGSHRANHLDAVCKGRKRAWGVQKLNAVQVIDIRARAAAGTLQRSLAADFGVSEGTVSQIVNRRTWAHLPAAHGRGDYAASAELSSQTN